MFWIIICRSFDTKLRLASGSTKLLSVRLGKTTLAVAEVDLKAKFIQLEITGRQTTCDQGLTVTLRKWQNTLDHSAKWDSDWLRFVRNLRRVSEAVLLNCPSQSGSTGESLQPLPDVFRTWRSIT